MNPRVGVRCRRGARRLWIILLLVPLGCGGEGQARPWAPLPGNPAPDWGATELDGPELHLVDLQGEVVLLNVWATWCGPCVREMPGLEALHRRFADRGLRVLGASIDRRSAEGEVRRFLENHDLTFTILLDPDQSVMSRFRTIGVPETFLLDREGIIVHRWIGEFEPEAAEALALVERVLGE